MKKIIATALIASSFVVSAQADVELGAGVGVSGVNASTLKMQIDIDQQFRIEPEISFASDGTRKDNKFGAGAYLLNKTSENISLYYGGKLVFNSYNFGAASAFATKIAGVAGFEYFLDPQVSLGAEAEFGINFGDRDGYQTASTAMMRYYF